LFVVGVFVVGLLVLGAGLLGAGVVGAAVKLTVAEPRLAPRSEPPLAISVPFTPPVENCTAVLLLFTRALKVMVASTMSPLIGVVV
jgi:hypothetical protein